MDFHRKQNMYERKRPEREVLAFFCRWYSVRCFAMKIITYRDMQNPVALLME